MDDSEYNYIPGPHLIDELTEVEEAVGIPSMMNIGDEEPDVTHVSPYADEPVVVEKWLAKYLQVEKTKL